MDGSCGKHQHDPEKHQEPKLSIGYYLKGETDEGLQFKEELAKILKGS